MGNQKDIEVKLGFQRVLEGLRLALQAGIYKSPMIVIGWLGLTKSSHSISSRLYRVMRLTGKLLH